MTSFGAALLLSKTLSGLFTGLLIRGLLKAPKWWLLLFLMVNLIPLTTANLDKNPLPMFGALAVPGLLFGYVLAIFPPVSWLLRKLVRAAIIDG